MESSFVCCTRDAKSDVVPPFSIQATSLSFGAVGSVSEVTPQTTGVGGSVAPLTADTTSSNRWQLLPLLVMSPEPVVSLEPVVWEESERCRLSVSTIRGS